MRRLLIAGSAALAVFATNGMGTAIAGGAHLVAPKLKILSATHHCGTTASDDYLVADFSASGLVSHSKYVLESNYPGEVDEDGQLFDFTAAASTYDDHHAHLRPPYASERISKSRLRVTFIAYDFGPAGDASQPAASRPVVVTIAGCP